MQKFTMLKNNWSITKLEDMLAKGTVLEVDPAKMISSNAYIAKVRHAIAVIAKAFFVREGKTVPVKGSLIIHRRNYHPGRL